MSAFNHEPIRRVRNSVGERVFYQSWKAMMEADSEKFDEILRSHVYPISQTDAETAASFITWLGTSIGSAFLDKAENLKEACQPMQYVAAWAIFNFRQAGQKRQIACLTITLAEFDGLVRDEVSIRELEVIEQLAYWLGCEEGQKFLSQCKNLIQHLIDLDHSASMRRQDLDEYVMLCSLGKKDTPRAKELEKLFTLVK